jgi:hypothetical protein
LPVSAKYKAILEGEAAKHKIRIKYHKKGGQWGRAALEWKMVWIPTPARFASFFTGLHELGHIIVGHKGGGGKPEYLWEYEAFAWARKYCVDHRIPVPIHTVDYEREIIAEKLRKSVEIGMKKVNPVVVGFIHEKKNEDPDVEWAGKQLDADGRVRHRE